MDVWALHLDPGPLKTNMQKAKTAASNDKTIEERCQNKPVNKII